MHVLSRRTLTCTVLLCLMIAAQYLVLSTECSAQGVDESPRPNILFAIADDWSYGHAGAYGCQWTSTPAFDRVAREGVLFTRAYTPNAKCAPSRACILTGRNSWQLEEAANHVCNFPPKFVSYPETLSAAGYFVGYTGKGWGPGIANDDSGKPRKITGQAFHKRKATPPTSGISNNDYAGNFADFLDASPKDTPWCFWYGATEPHRGYEYGSGVKKAGKNINDIEHVPAFWPDNETVRNDMLDYAVEVEHFDKHLSRILKRLEESGQLENTLVVVTSDHGMPFPRGKGQAYDHSNHIPLAIMWPENMNRSGRTVSDYVSFIDLAPTFVEAAGLQWDDTKMQPTPGRSLFDIISSNKSGQVNPKRDHVLIGKERHDVGRPHDWGYPIRGIVTGDMLYIRNYETSRWPGGNPETGYLNCDGGPTKTVVLKSRVDENTKRYWDLCFGKRPAEEMYNVKADPDCVHNLAADEGHAKLKAALETEMITRLKAQDDPRMFGEGDYFDKIPYVNAGNRNFYERYMAGEKVGAGWVNKSDFDQKLD